MSKVCTIGFMLTLLSVSYASSSSSSHSNSNSVFISSSESSDVWDGIEEYDPNIPCDTNLAQGKIDWLCNITNKGSLKTSDACTKKIIGNNVSIECGLLRNTSAECIVVVTTVFIKQDDNLNLNISALDGFEDFVYLKKLSIINAGLEKIPNLKSSVEYLNLASNKITDVSALSELSELSSLYLSNNSISGLDLTHLQELKELDLQNNKFTMIPESVFKLAKLEKFGINTDNNNVIDVPGISALKELRVLFLSNFNFTSGVPHGICDLPNLEFLTMNNCKIKKLPNCFASLSNLKHLSISYNDIAELQPIFLKFAAQLRSLNLNRNFISCEEVEEWNVDFLDRSCSETMQQNVTEYCNKLMDQTKCLNQGLCTVKDNACVPKEKSRLVLPSYLRSGVSGLVVSWLIKIFVTLF